ncbi:hypothetical protein GCM10009740_14450 [Terrabacter terrae]|uniref:Uncharacterized protein n=2 Tax=Terrabacter terrae TaxID=318434 RepID=A0ABN2U0B8_9MICO
MASTVGVCGPSGQHEAEETTGRAGAVPDDSGGADEQAGSGDGIVDVCQESVTPSILASVGCGQLERERERQG